MMICHYVAVCFDTVTKGQSDIVVLVTIVIKMLSMKLNGVSLWKVILLYSTASVTTEPPWNDQ